MTQKDNMIRLLSKRNIVWLCDDGNKKFIRKIFSDEKSYLIEKEIYQKLGRIQTITCPNLILYDDEKLVLEIEYIAGITVLEELELLESKNNVDAACKILIEVLNWLKEFSDCLGSKTIMHDVNLRNFILYEDKIYGIDFESSIQGTLETDFFQVIAMYGLYFPSHSDFKHKVINEIYNDFFKSAGYSKDRFLSCINDELKKVQLKREMYASKKFKEQPFS